MQARRRSLSEGATRQRGYTILELMMVLSIILLIFAGVFSTFDGSTFTGDITQNVGDADENIRASLTFMARDFSVAGAEITLGGIAVPSSFLPGNVLYPVMPFYNQGLTVNGQTTDRVMILYNDLALKGLNSDQASKNYVINGVGALDPSGGSITLNTTSPNPDATSISPGDILLVKTNSVSSISALGYVTAVPSVSTVNFAVGDPLNLNASGSSAPMAKLSCGPSGSGCTDQAVAFKVSLIQYFIGYADAPTNQVPALMRQVNGQTPTQLGMNIENLKLIYTITTGTTSVTDPNPTNPPNIRQASIFLMARSARKAVQDRAYYRIPMRVQVATRNLSYSTL